ncbi:DUF456 domain-containing protein [Aquabacterium sp. J223]|uniref:DUF456 domain-containing protein n=1 Tax=Aquabacterium sp. J223 TaxID=2898431 RepID=UPI0021ADD661|nr:DUF456 domain-containing protein [Aquabacterium sp. J223]UUX94745.1 DUF456 domain-containing protein [Aquabacterium sp. J223]
MNPTAWWALSWLLIVAGLAGTVLPVLPGTALVLAGTLLGAWIDDFTRVGSLSITVLVLLAVLSWVLEYVAGVLGAKRAGASKQAMVGAAIGTVAGLFLGLIGVLFLPLAGAAIGEFIARRHHGAAMRVGIATWMGLMAGLVAKVVIAFIMVGVFALALMF